MKFLVLPTHLQNRTVCKADKSTPEHYKSTEFHRYTIQIPNTVNKYNPVIFTWKFLKYENCGNFLCWKVTHAHFVLNEMYKHFAVVMLRYTTCQESLSFSRHHPKGCFFFLIFMVFKEITGPAVKRYKVVPMYITKAYGAVKIGTNSFSTL